MKIRPLLLSDGEEIIRIYREAFAGYPWFENLSYEEVSQRWSTLRNKRGLQGLVAEIDDVFAGVMWWDKPTIDELREERGRYLSDFVEPHAISGYQLVWMRETIVSPSFQNRGIAKALKEEAMRALVLERRILLTRMRCNNHAIIRINEQQGMRRTGITVPCRLDDTKYHEYWYQLVGEKLEVVG